MEVFLFSGISTIETADQRRWAQMDIDKGLKKVVFEVFEGKVVHGVFARHGGMSEKPYDSLNFSVTVGDSQECVDTNTERALKSLQLSRFQRAYQVHGPVVREVVSQIEPPKCDGLMTNQKGLGLLITHADCQAAIFYDPIHKALAVVHSGWRGSVANIYQETVRAMGKRYGSRPEELLVGISPSLGPEAAEFKNYKEELPRSFWEFQVKPNYFNFWEISRWQLLSAGLLPHHIEIARICTYTTPEDWFSYRRAPLSGRHATIAALQ